MLPTWTVGQIGARENYATARAFARLGRLERLYTDAWCRTGAGLLRRGPAFLRTLAGRRDAEVPSERVVSFTPSAVWGELRGRLGGRRQSADVYEEYLRVGRWFDRRVHRHLARHPLPPRSAFFTYNTGCLETIRLLRAAGLVTVVDQIDPARVEYEIVQTEAAKWPGWSESPPLIPDAYFDRLSAEWEAADVVVVNSEWSADALVRQGVPRTKIFVVPLASEPRPVEPRREKSGGPLVVLWLGNVILRKGIQYLIEAAKQLTDRAVRFLVAGPIGISPTALASAPANMEFLGRVTRDRTAEVYRSAHLFVLPTLSDGFAITQLEAMAHALPVVATPNCGAVVTHGADGLIVPAGDADALAAAIGGLDDDRPRLEEMGRRALEKAAMFPLSAFAERLDAAYAAVGPY